MIKLYAIIFMRKMWPDSGITLANVYGSCFNGRRRGRGHCQLTRGPHFSHVMRPIAIELTGMKHERFSARSQCESHSTVVSFDALPKEATIARVGKETSAGKAVMQIFNYNLPDHARAPRSVDGPIAEIEAEIKIVAKVTSSIIIRIFSGSSSKTSSFND